MAKAKTTRAMGRGVENSDGNEFTRGAERIWDGGEHAIVSPAGSNYDYPISSTNALETGLQEQGAGRGTTFGGKKGRR